MSIVHLWTVISLSAIIVVSSRTLAVDSTIVLLPKQGYIKGKIVNVKRIDFESDLNKWTGSGEVARNYTVDAYLGIPYSSEPERFMPPTSPPSFENVTTMDYMKPVCPQVLPDLDDPKMPSERRQFVKNMAASLSRESENCLNLNVYVPNEDNDRNKPYPVLVFIHGESLEWNSGNLYDGSVIAGYGKIIFVAVNFRLGIYGFLKTDFSGKPNNFGLLDQIAALKWIRSNIEYFNGDPNRITLMGHGTGAACVHFLMLSPMAEGLFHRAILMSGSISSVLSTNPDNLLETLAADLKCSATDIKTCLNQRTDDDIKVSTKNLRTYPFKTNNFTPTPDGIIVLDSVREQMESPESSFLKYDLLAGVTETESYFMLDDKYLTKGMDKNEAKKILETYINSQYPKSSNVALMKTMNEYINKFKTPTRFEIRNGVFEALSDALVTAPLLKAVKHHIKSRKSTSFYVFGHSTARKFIKDWNKSKAGDELPYVLGIPIDGKSYHYDGDYNYFEVALSLLMIKYWSNFVKTGNPNMPDDPKVKWPSYLQGRQASLLIDINHPSIIYDHRKPYDEFWNSKLPIIEKNCEKTGCFSSIDVLRMTSENPLYEDTFRDDVDTILTTDEITVVNDTATNPIVQESIAMLIAIGSVIFLTVNLCVFFFVYRSRIKSSTRCLNNSSGDDKTTIGDQVIHYNTKPFVEGSRKSKKSSASSSDELFYQANKLASIKPQAMMGKRIKRWPLSRQCSGSSITVDPHTKVKEWIAQEIVYKCSPKHLRTKESTNLSTTNIINDDDDDDKSRNSRKTKTISSSEDERPSGKQKKSSKVSVAVDATATARTASVLKQIPIELTKSLDDGKTNSGFGQLKSSSSLTAVSSKRRLERSGALSSDEYDDLSSSSKRNFNGGTHKTSATIRLKTPAIVREQLNIDRLKAENEKLENQQQPIYSRVDKKAKKLKNFPTADSGSKAETDNSVDSSGHYEDINVTSYREDLKECDGTDVKRRNLPKVLPDFPFLLSDNNADFFIGRLGSKHYNSKRMSLPYSIPENNTVDDDDNNNNFSRIPPLPPPRLTSTLGKKPTSSSISSSRVQLKSQDDVTNSDKKTTDKAFSSFSTSTESSYLIDCKSEPKIIIKPSSTSANFGKRRIITRTNQTSQIPRVTHSTVRDNSLLERPSEKETKTGIVVTGIPKLIASSRTNLVGEDVVHTVQVRNVNKCFVMLRCSILAVH